MPTTRALPAMAVEMPPPGTPSGTTGWVNRPSDNAGRARATVYAMRATRGAAAAASDTTHSTWAKRPRNKRRESVCSADDGPGAVVPPYRGSRIVASGAAASGPPPGPAGGRPAARGRANRICCRAP